MPVCHTARGVWGVRLYGLTCRAQGFSYSRRGNCFNTTAGLSVPSRPTSVSQPLARHSRESRMFFCNFFAMHLQPVEVLWIFNQKWSDWEAKLPKETQDLLAKDRGAHSSWLAKADFTGGELWDVFGNKVSRSSCQQLLRATTQCMHSSFLVAGLGPVGCAQFHGTVFG